MSKALEFHQDFSRFSKELDNRGNVGGHIVRFTSTNMITGGYLEWLQRLEPEFKQFQEIMLAIADNESLVATDRMAAIKYRDEAQRLYAELKKILSELPTAAIELDRILKALPRTAFDRNVIFWSAEYFMRQSLDGAWSTEKVVKNLQTLLASLTDLDPEEFEELENSINTFEVLYWEAERLN